MRSAVFLASAFMGVLRWGSCFPANWTAGVPPAIHKEMRAGRPRASRPQSTKKCGRDARGPALFPTAGGQSFLQRGKALRRCRHQPAEAFLDQLLDIVVVDMRVTAGDPLVLADREDVVDRGGDLG